MWSKELLHPFVYVASELGGNGKRWPQPHDKTIHQLWYLLCGFLYVGCTIRPLRMRLCEHKCNIVNITEDNIAKNKNKDNNKNKNKYNYSVSRHFKEHHNGNPTGRRFQKLCKRETFWIFTLEYLALEGLNEDLEVHEVIH